MSPPLAQHRPTVQPIADAIASAFPGTTAAVRLHDPSCGMPADADAYVKIEALTGETDSWGDVSSASLNFVLTGETITEAALSIYWPTTSKSLIEAGYTSNSTALDLPRGSVADLLPTLPGHLAALATQAARQRILDAEINDQQLGRATGGTVVRIVGTTLTFYAASGSPLAAVALDGSGLTVQSPVATVPIRVHASQHEAVLAGLGHTLLIDTGQFDRIRDSNSGLDFVLNLLAEVDAAEATR